MVGFVMAAVPKLTNSTHRFLVMIHRCVKWCCCCNRGTRAGKWHLCSSQGTGALATTVVA
jgi:hypothetical protein